MLPLIILLIQAMISIGNGSTVNPYATLIKANALSLIAGDSVLFKRGDIFRGQLNVSHNGNSTNSIVFSAYGTGNKPLISGAIDQSLTSNWINSTGNIWATSEAVSVWGDMGNIYFNNDASYGWRRMKLGECTAQGDFYFNSSDKKIYLYSVGNPGSFYTHLEVGGVYSEDVVRVYNHNYLTFDGLDIRYSANNGIIFCLSNYCTVQNCNFSWIGGTLYGGGPTRMGNGVQMWNTNSNIIIRDNFINQIYDAGISPQGGGMNYVQSNISIYRNLITNCWYSFEVFDVPETTMTNINFDNNTCVNAGYSWSAIQRPAQTNERHVMFWSSNPGKVSNFNIRNNVFKVCTNPALRFDNDMVNLEYNLYDVGTVGQKAGITYTTLAQWQAISGEEISSITGDPLFVSSTNYSLQSSSPARNAGKDIGLPYSESAPDIGAIEYLPESATKNINTKEKTIKNAGKTITQ